MSGLLRMLEGRDLVEGEEVRDGLAPGARLDGVTFAGCTITGAVWAEAVLARCRFEDCTLEGVDLSGTRWPDTVLDGCRFVDVRALGTAWGSLARPTIPPEPSTWTGCRLDLGAFGGADLSGARLERCSLVEADLDGVVLRGARLADCDLRGTRIIRADLREADLRGSHGYVLDPRANEVAGLRVDLVGAVGLLAPFAIEVD